MKKISTLFKKNPENLAVVINEPNPENQWVFDGEGVATRKFDGTACAVIGGKLYKRYDAKKGKTPPPNAIPCQPEPDPITGHWPHWIEPNPQTDKQWYDAWNRVEFYRKDGTYELCGPKIQGNPEKLDSHYLIPHGYEHIEVNRTWDDLRAYLLENDIEGIVFHHPDGRMCKIRKSDFGIKR